jgi:uncharacterized oligopeptide transporter (OPT) family protein
MSFTAFLGALAKQVYDRIQRARSKGMPEAEAQEAQKEADEAGLVVASGVLGGESIVGVIIAFVAVAAGLAG